VSALFGFEGDLDHGGLPCVPMAVRMKLDQAGVKLDLRAWLGFSEDERRELLAAAGGPAFRERVRVLASRTGNLPKDLLVPALPPWEEKLPPADLARKAADEGVPLDKWADLSPLQRFALLKLSRPGHENRNFLPACREFGLL
jgi:hypothetical protein